MPTPTATRRALSARLGANWHYFCYCVAMYGQDAIQTRNAEADYDRADAVWRTFLETHTMA